MATQIAHEEMELIRNKKFDDILILGSTFTHDLFSGLNNGEGAVIIQDGPGSDIKKITIRVSWEYRGVNRLKNIVTYIDGGQVNMTYPNRNHGIRVGEGTSLHLQMLMTRFLLTHLPPDPR